MNAFRYLLGLLMLCTTGAAAQTTITTVVGRGIGDDSLAVKSELFYPDGIVTDTAGNVYIADDFNNRIRRVDAATHIITTFAGTGGSGFSGDGGPAIDAQIGAGRLAIDKWGNIYVASAYRIRKINTAGIITTIAGNGTSGYGGDGGPATAATFGSISDMAVDTAGNLYIADFIASRVRRIDASGIINTIAGGGGVGYSPDGTPAITALLNRPFAVATDKQGNYYIGEYNNHVIRKVDATGTLTTIAGNSTWGYSGDGGPATAAEMSAPVAIKLDTAGNIYFSDNHNYCIRKVNTSGIITTVAGNGTSGFSGDGGPGILAEMSTPGQLGFTKEGNVLIACVWDNRIRELRQGGIIVTFAGQSGLFDDGIPGTAAQIGIINNIATDTLGRIYLADSYNNRIRRYDPATQLLTTVAGSGIAGYGDGFSGDGGPADSAHIYMPFAVATDRQGNIYIADAYNQRIRMVSAAGIISTIAGNGTAGFSGDGGPAITAAINYPNNVAVDGSGNIYIGDQGNNRIRKIDATGTITTIAGTGTAGYSGDGGPATAAMLSGINDLYTDSRGNIYIADASDNRIRLIDTTGIIRTIAGTGTAGFSGDGGPATSAALNQPTAARPDGAGNIYIADFGNSRVRKIDATGNITTIAGTGVTGFSGDGGPALSATFNLPAQLTPGANGDLYIADAYNYRVRKLSGLLSVAHTSPGTPIAAQVIPNPASSSITITGTAIFPAQVCLYDAAGRTQLTTQVAASAQAIGIASLPAGIYTVVITSRTGTQSTTLLEKQ